MISTPMNDSQLTEHVCRDCKLKIDGKEMTTNLILLNMNDFDVILGMDWFTTNRVVMDCHAKTLMFSGLDNLIVNFDEKK